jgi:hypothetical protein
MVETVLPDRDETPDGDMFTAYEYDKWLEDQKEFSLPVDPEE